MSVHNMAYKYDGLFDRAVDFLVKKSVSLFITGSNACREELKENRSLVNERVICIHHGIEPIVVEGKGTKIVPREILQGCRHITMVGIFEERKGQRSAVLSFKELLLKYPEHRDVRLVLIGDGPLLPEVKDLTWREGLGGNVLFPGRRSDYLDYVASGLFLLYPSLCNEDLPYVIMEAMSLGIPTLGTDVAGIPEEIKDGVNGIIVSPGDINALACAMHTLLFDSQKRRQMGLAARESFFKLFTKDRMIEDYLGLYKGLKNNHNYKG
ncbi:glycosyltransferase family 4 protein [Candidatus Omnitrophota bacterium]